MARIISFSVYRGAAYASTRIDFSQDEAWRDQPASELPEDEPKIKRRRRRRASRVALSGFVPSGRIGEPVANQDETPTAFEGGAEL